jgi:nitrile hydratase accessory protein
LSQPDSISETDLLKALPPLPRDADGPVFAEPWQAQAFAMTVQLNADGVFTWSEWATALAAELARHDDDGSHYYDHWLSALETLAVTKGLSDPVALVARKSAWAQAYLTTPHGRPVEL